MTEGGVAWRSCACGWGHPADRPCQNPIHTSKPSKYRARSVKTADGVFASQAEHRRWCELRVLAKAGMIRDLRRQVAFPLHALGGARLGKYVADFTYREADTPIVEDVKGMWTALARWKVRHFEREYRLSVRIT